jgi:hypothetical protein
VNVGEQVSFSKPLSLLTPVCCILSSIISRVDMHNETSTKEPLKHSNFRRVCQCAPVKTPEHL